MDKLKNINKNYKTCRCECISVSNDAYLADMEEITNVDILTICDDELSRKKLNASENTLRDNEVFIYKIDALLGLNTSKYVYKLFGNINWVKHIDILKDTIDTFIGHINSCNFPTYLSSFLLNNSPTDKILVISNQFYRMIFKYILYYIKKKDKRLFSICMEHILIKNGLQMLMFGNILSVNRCKQPFSQFVNSNVWKVYTYCKNIRNDKAIEDVFEIICYDTKPNRIVAGNLIITPIGVVDVSFFTYAIMVYYYIQPQGIIFKNYKVHGRWVNISSLMVVSTLYYKLDGMYLEIIRDGLRRTRIKKLLKTASNVDLIVKFMDLERRVTGKACSSNIAISKEKIPLNLKFKFPTDEIYAYDLTEPIGCLSSQSQ